MLSGETGGKTGRQRQPPHFLWSSLKANIPKLRPFSQFSGKSRRISLHFRLCGGGGSPTKLFSGKFPANGEKYREFREFPIEIHLKFLGATLILWGLLFRGSKHSRESLSTEQGIVRSLSARAGNHLTVKNVRDIRAEQRHNSAKTLQLFPSLPVIEMSTPFRLLTLHEAPL
jgi:hypothetical protein